MTLEVPDLLAWLFASLEMRIYLEIMWFVDELL